MKVNREAQTLPPGRHSATIHRAEEKVSKAGNPMMKLSLKVVLDGETYWVTEYVMNNRPKTIDAIHAAIGYPEGLEVFDPEKLEGAEVMIVTKIEEQEGYDPQARVEKWIPKADALAKAVNAPVKAAVAASKKPMGRRQPDDDDIPF